VRDAVVAALHFHLFHARAERVRMTNIAQMANVLQAMIHTDGDRMVLTPTYHAFALYVPFQGATTLPAQLDKVPEVVRGEQHVPAVSVSAARTTDGRLVLALVNSDPKEAHAVQVTLPNGAPARARGQLISARTLDAHNTFEQPEAVVPKPVQQQRKGKDLTLPLPPASVQVVVLEP
jgi:alpha-N-arabinofuranosidase